MGRSLAGHIGTACPCSTVSGASAGLAWMTGDIWRGSLEPRVWGFSPSVPCILCLGRPRGLLHSLSWLPGWGLAGISLSLTLPSLPLLFSFSLWLAWVSRSMVNSVIRLLTWHLASLKWAFQETRVKAQRILMTQCQKAHSATSTMLCWLHKASLESQ